MFGIYQDESCAIQRNSEESFLCDMRLKRGKENDRVSWSVSPFETLVKYAEEIELNQSSSSVTQVLVDPAPADDDDGKKLQNFQKKSMS